MSIHNLFIFVFRLMCYDNPTYMCSDIWAFFNTLGQDPIDPGATYYPLKSVTMGPTVSMKYLVGLAIVELNIENLAAQQVIPVRIGSPPSSTVNGYLFGWGSDSLFMTSTICIL